LRPSHGDGRVKMCPGFHGAYTAGVRPGSTVYVAGAGPVGLACAASCHLLGAAVVIVGDMIPDRLAQAKSFGCEVVDISKGPVAEQIQQILGTPQVPMHPPPPPITAPSLPRSVSLGAGVVSDMGEAGRRLSRWTPQ
jgi:threonine dehydrogenase-like Zn-dependent dehydrogenase